MREILFRKGRGAWSGAGLPFAAVEAMIFSFKQVVNILAFILNFELNAASIGMYIEEKRLI